MKRRQTYQRGSKGLLYINQGVSDNLIEFINKQTELNGVLLLGLKLVAEKYGDIDVINYVPRTFDLNSLQTMPVATPVQQQAPPTDTNTGQSLELISQKSMDENDNDDELTIEEQLRVLKAENERLKTENNQKALSQKSVDNTNPKISNKKNLFDEDNGEDLNIFPK